MYVAHSFSAALPQGAKHVTVSTVGVLKNMYRLSDELPQVNLALSLHAPNQEVRSKIVPAGKAHHINKLMEAVDYHIRKNAMLPLDTAVAARALFHEDPGRRGKITGIMIEYILIKDVNDLDEHAHQLGQLLVSRREHLLLNLIPYNPTEVAEDYQPPLPEQVQRFYQICSGPPYYIFTRVRQEKGQDIAGACGQLALVRGNNKGGTSFADAQEKDVEDIAGVKTMKPPKTLNKQLGTNRLDDVHRSHEVHSLYPVDEAVIRRDKAWRCQWACYLNLLLPAGLMVMDLLWMRPSAVH
jgi:hypothetical protein